MTPQPAMNPKPLRRSRTAWLTTLWGALNAMLLVLQASMNLLEGQIPILAYIGLNMAVAGALFALRTVTTQPVTFKRKSNGEAI